MADFDYDDIVSRVASEIGLNNQTGSAERTRVQAWVREGHVQLLRRTKLKIVKADLALTADEDDYTLPTNVLSVDRMILTTSANDQRRIEPMSADELDEKRRFDLAGADPMFYSLEGYDLLRVWPTPTTALSISFLYVPRPTAMSAGTDEPEYVPDEYRPALEAYGKWRAAEWDDDTSSKVGAAYMDQWNMWLRDIRADTNLRGGGWGPVRVKRNRPFSASPGVDLGL